MRTYDHKLTPEFVSQNPFTLTTDLKLFTNQLNWEVFTLIMFAVAVPVFYFL